MAEETVTLKNGNTKRVVAPDEKDLKDAVAAAKAEDESVPFDINVPVQKGHDLLHYDEDLTVTTVDGTGAHNSPMSAINEDTGEVRGSDPLFVAPSNQVVERQMVEVTGSGETKEVSAEDVASSESAADEKSKS